MIFPQSSSSNWYIKYFDAVFIFIAGGYMLHSLVMFLPEKTSLFFDPFLRIRYRFLLVPAAMGLIYLVIAGNRERKSKFNAETAHAIVLGLIRFWLAAAISSYGFAKVTGAQFNGADQIILRDSLLGDVSGNYLTWYYFNFSPSYILIIGYLQIGGALLLLFRRTTLLGLFVLLPVMANIVLIDLFYGIPAGPNANSLVLTAALIYLLLLHSKKLINLFFKTGYGLPIPGNGAFKNILRIAVVVFAFISIYQSSLRHQHTSTPGDDAILGKWQVEQSSINGADIQPNAWQTDSGTWAAIYFIDNRYCAIASNPYFFDRQKQNFGKYTFHKSKHLLNIQLLNTRDSLHGWIDFLSSEQILVKGLLGRDTINMRLNKVKM